MKIEYKSEYERCGCKFSGDLAIVEYWEESTNHSRKLALEGFWRGTCYDYLGKAKELLLASHPRSEILLGLPVLVARITAAEYQEKKRREHAVTALANFAYELEHGPVEPGGNHEN